MAPTLSRSPDTRTRGPFANVRPSYLILLTAAPFVVYLFLTADSYQRALRFLLPGVGTTAFVTVVAYIAASALGLLLAGMQMIRLGKRTVLSFALAGAVLLAGSVVAFTRPHVHYSLVGAEGGLVAFGAARSQSARALESAWKAVPEHKRRAIERYLVSLGVSSTGTVRLVGAWQLDGRPLLHFQHLDLLGDRLVWSVLVDPVAMTARPVLDPDAVGGDSAEALIPADPD
mgnify:CR=1 FL=1